MTEAFDSSSTPDAQITEVVPRESLGKGQGDRHAVVLAQNHGAEMKKDVLVIMTSYKSFGLLYNHNLSVHNGARFDITI